MRAFQIFASMPHEQSATLLEKISESSPIHFQQGLATACGALKIRPVYIKKQPFAKQASSVRRALSLVASNTMAEEILAIYFLECRKELLVEWLEALGLDQVGAHGSTAALMMVVDVVGAVGVGMECGFFWVHFRMNQMRR